MMLTTMKSKKKQWKEQNEKEEIRLQERESEYFQTWIRKDILKKEKMKWETKNWGSTA